MQAIYSHYIFQNIHKLLEEWRVDSSDKKSIYQAITEKVKEILFLNRNSSSQNIEKQNLIKKVGLSDSQLEEINLQIESCVSFILASFKAQEFCDFETFPIEVLSKIISLSDCSLKTLFILFLQKPFLSNPFLETALIDAINWYHLPLSPSTGFNSIKQLDYFLKTCGHRLTCLHIREFEEVITDALLAEFLSYCPQLQHLYLPLEKSRITSLKPFIHLSELKTLEISIPLAPDEEFVQLQNFNKLQSLTLFKCLKITGVFLEKLNCSCLKKINLAKAPKLKTEPLRKLEACTNLQTVCVSGCVGLTSAFIPYIPKTVTAFDISYTKVGELNAEGISRLNNLKSLDISFCKFLSAIFLETMKCDKTLQTLKFTKATCLADFRHFSALKELYVSELSLDSEASAKVFDKIPNSLKGLRLNRSDLSRSTFSKVSRFTDLVVLDLSYCQLPEDFLTHFSSRTSLKTLKVAYNNDIQDSSLSGLSLFTNLEELDASGCVNMNGEFIRSLPKSVTSLNLESVRSLTDKKLELLKELFKLTNLNLMNCHLITGEFLLTLENPSFTHLSLRNCKRLKKVFLAFLKITNKKNNSI